MAEIHTVTVTHMWQGHKTFEFDTEEEADEFRDTVNSGGSAGLDAIVEHGDIFSGECDEIYDYSAL